MKSGLLAVAVLGLLLLAGCAEDDPYVPELRNNEISRTWAGAYTGIGSFNAPAFGVSEREVAVTVRLYDQGENRVRVELYVSPNPDEYSPRMRFTVPTDSYTRVDYRETIEGTTYSVLMNHAGSQLTASMAVIGAGETGATWSVGLTAYNVQP